MKEQNVKPVIGWIAAGFSIAITCVWAFWGAIETFHEGWYYESFIMNMGLASLQYLSPMFIFMGVGIISMYWHRVGGVIHIMVALFAAWFFGIFTNAAIILIIVPLLGIGLFYWYGSPPSRKIAIRGMIGLPILVALVSGLAPAYRVSQRITDRNLDAQRVAGNGITLTWAPSGPGWPQEGTNWYKAAQACQSLSQDGKTVAYAPPNIWRLPTVEETVRSMALHGENSHGVWDSASAIVEYEKGPDKEFPLWDIYSPIIYWWTATEVDQKNAYIIVYDGKVWPRAKQAVIGNLGFRCVK